MIPINRDTLTFAAIAVSVLALGAIAFVVSRGGLTPAGKSLGTGAVNLAGGILDGTVTGIGQIMGVPETNLTECQRAIAEGRRWDASFACPASTFIKSIFN